MNTLIAFICMTLIAFIFIFLAIFPLKNVKLFILIGISITLLAISLYIATADFPGLYFWHTQGENHYRLLAQLKKLGGIEGVIQQLEKRLEANPEDAQGWLILSKVYFQQQQYSKAKQAINKAHSFEPQNKEIDVWYQKLKKSKS